MLTSLDRLMFFGMCFHIPLVIVDSLVAMIHATFEVQVPQWQSDLMTLLAKPSTEWNDVEHQLLQFLMGRIGFQLPDDPQPAVEPPVEDPVSYRAPRDWRQIKERTNAGSWSTDYFGVDASKEKPYRMNGWFNRMIPLLGAHLRGDSELANRLAFKYAENKGIEKQVDTHNQVMFLRGFDPKYGVEQTLE